MTNKELHSLIIEWSENPKIGPILYDAIQEDPTILIWVPFTNPTFRLDLAFRGMEKRNQTIGMITIPAGRVTYRYSLWEIIYSCDEFAELFLFPESFLHGRMIGKLSYVNTLQEAKDGLLYSLYKVLRTGSLKSEE